MRIFCPATERRERERERAGKHREMNGENPETLNLMIDRSREEVATAMIPNIHTDQLTNGRRRRALRTHRAVSPRADHASVTDWSCHRLARIVSRWSFAARRYSFQNILHTSVQENVFLSTWTRATPRMRVRGKRPSPFIRWFKQNIKKRKKETLMIQKTDESVTSMKNCEFIEIE